MFDIENFDSDNLMEFGNKFKNTFKSLNGVIHGAESFLALQLNSLMSMSLSRDIEDELTLTQKALSCILPNSKNNCHTILYEV